MAALGTICSAALMISSVSMADETIPTIPVGDSPAIAPQSEESHENQGSSAADPKVVFAALKEIVQPLPETPSEPEAPADVYTSLAAMVRGIDVQAPLDKEAHCLATAVFYESRSESLEGQLAVARVIINRAASPRFANSLCNVIRQRGQFSFVRRGVIPAPKTSRPAWKTSIAVARIALENAWKSEAEGALYFHARYVSPRWKRAQIASIDNHIFYR